MAKQHKNIEKIPIQWDAGLDHPQAGDKNQSIPASVDLGPWAGFKTCWADGDYTRNSCNITTMTFEDFDLGTEIGGIHHYPAPDGTLNTHDVVAWIDAGRPDVASSIVSQILNTLYAKPKPSWEKIEWKWSDVFFLQEIVDGIGTGSRRAREARLNQFEEEKKKRLVRLICRVKGEKVYDEEKELGDTYIKLEDADLVINEVLGKMRVENANVL